MVIVEYWTGYTRSAQDRVMYDEYPELVDWWFGTNGILYISIDLKTIASYEPGSWIKVHREDED